MNVVAIIGRLTRDPEIRYSQDGMAISTMMIAVDRPPKKDGTKETDFPRITVFGKQAENCQKYLKKGLLVGVNGHIQTGSYTNKNGDKVYTTDVVAERITYLEWGDKQQAQQQAPQNQYPPQQNQYQPQQNYSGGYGQPGQYAQPNPQYGQPQQYQQMPTGFEAITDDNIPF